MPIKPKQKLTGSPSASSRATFILLLPFSLSMRQETYRPEMCTA